MSKRAREQRLQDLKRQKVKMTPLSSSIPMVKDTKVIHQASKPSVYEGYKNNKEKKVLKVMTKWNDADIDIITWSYKGSGNPKVVNKGKRKLASFLLEPMVVLSSDLAQDGNLKLVGDPSKARYTVELGTGLGKAPKRLKDQLDLKQEECLQFLDKTAKEALEHAFFEDLWGKKGELEHFLQGANHCWKKEGIQLKRRLTTFGGESNRPIFWKKNKKSMLYEELELDELPEGSIIQCEGSLRFFSFKDDEKEMYGSSLDLGENILVHWMPETEYTDNIYIDF